MGAEALLGPLTGIGRYTLELSRELAASGELEELRFLAHGRLLPPEAVVILDAPVQEMLNAVTQWGAGASIIYQQKTPDD